MRGSENGNNNKRMVKVGARGNRAKASSKRKTNLNLAKVSRAKVSKASRSKAGKGSKVTNRDNKLSQVSAAKTGKGKPVRDRKVHSRVKADKVRESSRLLPQINNVAVTIPVKAARINPARAVVTVRVAGNVAAAEGQGISSINSAVKMGATLRAARLRAGNTRNGRIVCVTWKKCWMCPNFGPKRRGFVIAPATRAKI